MSLERLKFLLGEHRIVPNRLLGQNFMFDSSIYPILCAHAMLSAEDKVLDAGAGFGFLTAYLAERCKHVIAVEKDPSIARVLQEQVGNLDNVTVIEGDVLKVAVPAFNKVVSIPPYYLSSKLLLWLLDKAFDCVVLIVQKEFAKRLVASVGSEDYSWLTVVTNQAAAVEILDDVPNWMFHPQPEVNSIIIRLKPLQIPVFTVKDIAFFRRLTKWLFTDRNRKLSNALRPFIKSQLKLNKLKAEEMSIAFPQRNKRVRELNPSDFGAIADALCQ